jgi:hypothetical protein
MAFDFEKAMNRGIFNCTRIARMNMDKNKSIYGLVILFTADPAASAGVLCSFKTSTVASSSGRPTTFMTSVGGRLYALRTIFSTRLRSGVFDQPASAEARGGR